MTTSKNIKYIPAVDHLRAYAAILVLFFHSFHHIYGKIPSLQKLGWLTTSNPMMTVIVEGHTAVALFIVLSGFIFTYGSAGQKINYLQFLYNRLLRIYPLMLTLTFIGISAFRQKLTISGFICILLPFQNTSAALDLSFYTAVFWTIAVECQFYLIFPFLNRILTEKRYVGLLPVFGLTMIARISAVLLGGNPHELSYFTILGRLDQFMIGMMVAAVIQDRTIQDRRLRWGVAVGGAGLLLAIFSYNRLGGYPVVSSWKIIWPPIEGLLWGIFVAGYLALMHEKENLLLRLIANIGTISYSIYLIHLIVIGLVAKHSLFFILSYNSYLGPLLSTAIIVLPITIIISSLTYHVVEKPFLQLRHSYMKPVVINSAALDESADNSLPLYNTNP